MISSDNALDVLRIRLSTFVETQGPDIFKNRAKCIPLLKDALASEALEAKAIIAAFESNVSGILAYCARHATTDTTMDTYLSSLAQKEKLSIELARWVVESWAIALEAVGESLKSRETHVVPPVLYAPPMAQAKQPSDQDTPRPKHKNFDGAASPMPMPIRLGSMGGVKSTEAQVPPEMHLPASTYSRISAKFRLPHSFRDWNLKARVPDKTTRMLLFGCITGGLSGLLAGLLPFAGVAGAMTIGVAVFSLSAMLYFRKWSGRAFKKPPVAAWAVVGMIAPCSPFFSYSHYYAIEVSMKWIIYSAAIGLIGAFLLALVFYPRKRL
ncbi:MAG: hypothetical protein WC712_08065 [Candidatus Brocadiia bacterium]